MGAKPQVAATVQHLKKLFGENSPQIEAIRMDLLNDVAAPLFEPSPNYKGFIRNYDNIIRKRPELVRELGLDNKDLMFLRKAAEGAEAARGKRAFGLDLSTAAARFFFGHKIARAAVRVTFARAAIDQMFQVGKTGRRTILSEIAGMDISKPLIPRDEFLGGATVAAGLGIERERENERQGR